MEGILINRKSSFSLVFIIGLVFLAVSVIDLIVNSHLNLYLIPGLLCLALDALPQLLRRRAYIRIDDHEIHARAVLSGNLHCTMDDIDAVAVTYAPGLVGSLLVGLSYAKAFAFASGLTLNAIMIAPDTFASVTSDSVTPPTFE